MPTMLFEKGPALQTRLVVRESWDSGNSVIDQPTLVNCFKSPEGTKQWGFHRLLALVYRVFSDAVGSRAVCLPPILLFTCLEWHTARSVPSQYDQPGQR